MKRAEKELLIIIPAYNEAGNIGKVLEDLKSPEIAKIADILVVDDASSDGTNREAKKHDVQVLSQLFNLGYGTALQIGYKYAIRGRYRYMIQMDADGQHDVCNIMPIYEMLKTKDENGNEPDIVLGSRFLDGSGDYPEPVIKKIAVAMLRWLLRVSTGKHIADPTTGLQGLSWRAALYYSKFGRFDDKYPDANTLLEMLLLKYRVEEIPAVMHIRTQGTSMHSGLKPILYMFRMFFAVPAAWLRVKVFKESRNFTEEMEFWQ